MFPLNDFNFVACALATVSAAVGYRVSRGRTRGTNGSTGSEQVAGKSRLRFLNSHRRNSTASARSASVAATECDTIDGGTPEYDGTPHPEGQENIADEVEEGSLKRKRSLSPSPMDSAFPPSKRRKTPEPESHNESAMEEEGIVSQQPEGASMGAAQAATKDDTDRKDVQADPSWSPCEPKVDNCPAIESGPSPASSTTSTTHLPKSPLAGACQAPTWPSIPSAIVAAKPSSAFNAFSSAPSAFASASTAFAQATPAWSNAVNDAAPVTTETDPLAAFSYAKSTQTTVTGEEDEDVAAEVKGAKVFIKRGDRDFCEGILGNVKLLKHRQSGHERILFRREPVMKVSMNVRLRPIVRCSFEEAQGLLRVALKEPSEDVQQEQVIVYALKRGKSSRTDFVEFAQTVVKSASLLHEQVPV
ncbi:hypothetical protein BV20DRAFT_970391 [Pilatotrama ljubarskyi]|nr:hypothetical protein BV20DRAFT_970391 [Pilatotrama ljubarskyi]